MHAGRQLRSRTDRERQVVLPRDVRRHTVAYPVRADARLVADDLPPRLGEARQVPHLYLGGWVTGSVDRWVDWLVGWLIDGLVDSLTMTSV